MAESSIRKLPTILKHYCLPDSLEGTFKANCKHCNKSISGCSKVSTNWLKVKQYINQSPVTATNKQRSRDDNNKDISHDGSRIINIEKLKQCTRFDYSCKSNVMVVVFSGETRQGLASILTG